MDESLFNEILARHCRRIAAGIDREIMNIKCIHLDTVTFRDIMNTPVRKCIYCGKRV
jgi:hypothetical protein